LSEFHDLDRRVAVLERIAQETVTALGDIRSELRQMRTDMLAEFRAVRAEGKSDYRWLIGIMLGGFGLTIGGFAGLLAVMAHGFHWI
jgi:hypothetical protein